MLLRLIVMKKSIFRQVIIMDNNCVGRVVD